MFLISKEALVLRKMSFIYLICIYLKILMSCCIRHEYFTAWTKSFFIYHLPFLKSSKYLFLMKRFKTTENFAGNMIIAKFPSEKFFWTFAKSLFPQNIKDHFMLKRFFLIFRSVTKHVHRITKLSDFSTRSGKFKILF